MKDVEVDTQSREEFNRRSSTKAPSVRRYAADLWDRREFAFYLALGNLRAKNVSTALGLFWWVLNPLLLGGIYALVFGVILNVRRGTDHYIAYLLSGIFPFFYLRSVLTGSVRSIISNRKLIMNLRFPRLILPLSALIESAVGFVASLSVFYLIVGPVHGVWPRRAIVWLLPGFLAITVFSLGLAALVARVAVPFRDLNNLVPYLLRLWLYLSPIIYPVGFLENVDERLENILQANPLFPILAIHRHALIGGDLVSTDVLMAFAWSVAMLVVGVGVFLRYEHRMPRYL